MLLLFKNTVFMRPVSLGCGYKSDCKRNVTFCILVDVVVLFVVVEISLSRSTCRNKCYTSKEGGSLNKYQNNCKKAVPIIF